MNKKILITGATSGIGLETARTLAAQGHHLLVHGRSASKVDDLTHALSQIAGAGTIEGFVADLSRMLDIEAFAAAVHTHHSSLDVLINNAGVFKTSRTITPEQIDVRFMVNTLAPMVLTQRLLPLLGRSARIINLSSAAQQPVNLGALAGHVRLQDFDAYAQSKLALTMWSSHLGRAHNQGPVYVAINPGSMLGTNMVKQGFGVEGKDVSIGSDILVRAALSEKFAQASGAYFDNDSRQFAKPHPDALNTSKCEALISRAEQIIHHLNTPS
jgi:NAD(P)-dependent dehydrogenase (short-subunit alcohol dehydrogenase family)